MERDIIRELDDLIESMDRNRRIARLTLDHETRRDLGDAVLATHPCTRERGERFGDHITHYRDIPIHVGDTGGSIFLVAFDAEG